MAARSRKPENVRRRQKRRLENLLLEERALWADGWVVAGLDEAGAGPLAGPVTAGCVVLDEAGAKKLLGVDDSKKLTTKQRADHAERVKDVAVAWAIADASVEEIDKINIRQAGLLAMRRALDKVLKKEPQVGYLLIDARTLEDGGREQKNIIGGDGLSLSIAAASILAKVDRDAVMTAHAETFPEYGFEKNKGYGTSHHMQALEKHGATSIHRRSFAPVHQRIHQLRLFD